jgi:phosphatidylglycerophosphatase A
VKIQSNTLSIKLSKVFLSFFGIGYAPKAPGTFGSAATLPLIYLLSSLENVWYLILVTGLLLLIATISCEYVQKKMGLHDPGWIVMDEVIGMLVTWAFIFPSTKTIDLLLVFIIFRVFDIFKIWPATYFDKKVKHGFGTIFDDVISGIYAGLILYLIKNFYLIN